MIFELTRCHRQRSLVRRDTLLECWPACCVLVEQHFFLLLNFFSFRFVGITFYAVAAAVVAADRWLRSIAVFALAIWSAAHIDCNAADKRTGMLRHSSELNHGLATAAGAAPSDRHVCNVYNTIKKRGRERYREGERRWGRLLVALEF